MIKINRRQVGKILASLLSVASFFAIPALGTAVVAFFFVKINDLLGYHHDNIVNPVNKNACSCQCWDGFYRSKYPRTSHDTEYKVFYFNYERKFLAIIYLILIGIKISDKILAKLFRLAFDDIKCLSRKYQRTQARGPSDACSLRAFSAINILFALASNVYAVWACVNYLNESDDRMLSSQLFFMVTEFIPTYVYYQTLNRYSLGESGQNVKNHVTIDHLAPIVCISALHLYIAISEEVLWGLVYSSHRANLVRDIVLVFSDIFGLVFSIFYLLRMRIVSSRLFSSRANSEKMHLYHNTDNLDMSLRSLLTLWLVVAVFLYQYYKLFCRFEQ